MRDVNGGLAWDMEEGGYSLLPFEILYPLRWEPTYDEENDRELLRLYDPRKERWRRVQTHWGPVLEALADGATLPEAHARAAEAMPEREDYEIRFILRKVITGLQRLKMAEVRIPEVPPVLGERFEVVEELGRGGMGVVWRCKDMEDGGREVAVKHAWNWGGSLESREGYLREEVEHMRLMDHPGIVRVLTTFEEDGRLHVARDLVEGPSLKVIGRTEAVGPVERARRLTQVADVLSHIQDRGYMALDIKTSNFRIDEANDQPTLIDLGILYPLEGGMAEVRGYPGTRKYQDPYLMEADQTDQRSTVFSLGKILYEFVVGRSPKPRGHLASYGEQKVLDLERMAEAGATEAEIKLYDVACSPAPERRPATLKAFVDRLG